MTRNEKSFVVCINNKGLPSSLEIRKLYLMVPDEQAAKLGQIRVIDESVEDYLYPAGYFAPVRLPDATQKAVLRPR